MKRLVAALVLVPAIASAQPATDPAPTEPVPTEPAPSEPPSDTDPVVPPSLDELAADVDALYEKQRELESAQRRDVATRERVDKLMPLSRFINVYADVGAFAVGGDGSGIRTDIGHVYFPQYMGRIAGQWVFMGDPLSTAINSRGDIAEHSD